jgi:hypothetical protein
MTHGKEYEMERRLREKIGGYPPFPPLAMLLRGKIAEEGCQVQTPGDFEGKTGLNRNVRPHRRYYGIDLILAHMFEKSQVRKSKP